MRGRSGPSDRRTAALDDIGFRMVVTASGVVDWPYQRALVGKILGERMAGYTYAFAHADELGEPVALTIAALLSTLEDSAFGQYWGCFAIETIGSTVLLTDERLARMLELLALGLPPDSGRRRMVESLVARMTTLAP